MELFHRLYLVCLGGTMGWTVFVVLLYLKLDIRTAWKVLMGGPAGKKEKVPRKKPGKGKKIFRFLAFKKQGESEETTVFLNRSGGKR